MNIINLDMEVSKANIFNRVKICIIDDDFDLIMAMNKYFPSNGQVFSYSWSKDHGIYGAYAQLLKTKYDIYFIDLNLPGANGMDIGRTLRRKVTANAPIVYISAERPKAQDLAGTEDKKVFFLPKPFTREKLLEFTEQVLA